MYRSVLFGAIFFGTLQGVCNAFVIQSYKDLVLKRMDPIVSPGQVSGHVHVFQGSSGLAPTSTYDDIFGGKCSTMGTQEDKSNYWVAQVYGKNANGTLSPLPMSEFRAYYINNTQGVPMVPIPPGFRMMIGDYSGTSVSTPAGKLVWYCQNGGNETQVQTIPPEGCSGFLRMSVEFPSCWNGVDLDSPSHNSHVAYRLGDNTCPSSHPSPIFTLVEEAGFDTSRYPGPGQVVMSTGDDIGLGIHGDYMFGWNPTTFQAAMDDPTCQAREGIFPQAGFSSCNTLSATANITLALECNYKSEIIQEPVGVYDPLPSLPGCNAFWGGPNAPKPTCSVSPPTPELQGPIQKTVNFYANTWPYTQEWIPIATTFIPASSTTASSTTASSTTPSTTASSTTASSTTASSTPASSTPIASGTVYVCNESGWAGTCENMPYESNACTTFTGTVYYYDLQSIGPNEGTCTLYSDLYCANPISGYTAVTSPGYGSLSVAWDVGSMMCTYPTTPTPVGSGTVYICNESNWSGSCSNLSWNSYSCQDLSGTEFDGNVGSLGPSQGTCSLYSDPYCANLISIDNSYPGTGNVLSLTNGIQISSYMCI